MSNFGLARCVPVWVVTSITPKRDIFVLTCSINVTVLYEMDLRRQVVRTAGTSNWSHSAPSQQNHPCLE